MAQAYLPDCSPPMTDTPSLRFVLAATLSAVDWESVQKQISTTLGITPTSTSWGEIDGGRYNLVRFLCIEGRPDVVVRVPLGHVEDSETAVQKAIFAMQYFHENTKIPLPRIICYSTSSKDVGKPYIASLRWKELVYVKFGMTCLIIDAT